MTRAEEILEAYGVYFYHQPTARRNSNQAHHRAHRMAHREARRVAHTVGMETVDSTPGDFRTKYAAASTAAGKAYHDTYGKVYSGFHHAYARQSGLG